jgi:TATA-box binding protein (TBP) (component of TFIID and TFIIIB)
MATTTSTKNIDDEWQNFISSKYEDDDNASIDLEAETEEDQENPENGNDPESILSADIAKGLKVGIEAPVATDIYISTKSKIAYLNQQIDLKTLFWGIKVIPYSTPKNGIIKKQMKFNSLTQEDLDIVQENLKNETHYDQQIITSINNPAGRIKFKDIRKISVGVSKKDIMSYRCKQKSAFYNCFVMIMRLKIKDTFKEFHIKVFNTGKMEIPGVQNDEIFQEVLNTIITTMQPFIEEPLSYNQKCDTVLINSNFNCGFFINRELLFDLMKYKYNIQCIYDPCSYPGIQCKFYYNPDVTVQTGSQISEEDKKKYTKIVEVSFMIFRTGSILIVGMCDEHVLYTIYEFLKKMLVQEFNKINQKVITAENTPLKDKKKKIRKKSILVDVTV